MFFSMVSLDLQPNQIADICTLLRRNHLWLPRGSFRVCVCVNCPSRSQCPMVYIYIYIYMYIIYMYIIVYNWNLSCEIECSEVLSAKTTTLESLGISPLPLNVLNAPVDGRTAGTLFMVFFISLCSSLLAPFRCNLHPNGRWTVQAYHGVQPWLHVLGVLHISEDWRF